MKFGLISMLGGLLIVFIVFFAVRHKEQEKLSDNNSGSRISNSSEAPLKELALPGAPARDENVLSVPTTMPPSVKEAYVDADTGRIINPNDSDGDGLGDDWEMRRYGTLEHDSKTCLNALRIDIKPAIADPRDVDGDGLPDEWEIHYLGHLRTAANDDPDQDGFDNITEFRLKQSPVSADVVDSKLRPESFRRLSAENPGINLFDMAEFWAKQDVLRHNRSDNR